MAQVARRNRIHSKATKLANLRGSLQKTSPDAAGLFSMVASTATIFLTFCSLVGYSFLVKYYELFGIRYSDLLIGSEHLFLRGFDLLRQNWEMLVLFSITLLSLVFIFIGTFLVGSLRIAAVFGLLLIGVGSSAAAIAYCSTLAREYGTRDMFSETTALRQLHCLNTKAGSVQQFLRQTSKNGQKILILAKSANQLILFQEPPIVSDNPRVRVAIVELSDGDVTQTAIASIADIGNDGSFDCDG